MPGMIIITQNGTLRATELCCSIFSVIEAEISEKTCQLAPDTALEPCWKLAKHWLSSCLTNHTRCTRFLSATPFQPTRLVEIAPLASASDDELHLRIAGEHSPLVPYMTLSHCWGKSEFLKLTKTTYQRLRDGFSAADTLSKTFQDAIIICRELGVKYLWIDSLCIFQDSAEDWRYEAAQMGQVYEHSLCNIAATGVFNDEEGCFRDRDVSFVQRCTIKSEWEHRHNATWEIINHHFWRARINRAPLNRRGWVMQERWLSPRVLHYGRDQILWECSELDACETYPAGLPKPLRTYDSGFKLDPELLEPLEYRSVAKTSDPHSLLRSTWKFFVQAYGEASLTKEEDKLVAISGIAKRMQGLLDDEYLAGLWRKNLPSQLLWAATDYARPSSLPSRKPRSYRAPSWSWASTDGPISDDWGTCDGILITILDARVTPVGTDPTGQIKDGLIRLKGRLVPAEVVRDPKWPGKWCKLRVNSEVLDYQTMLDTVSHELLGTPSVYLLPIQSYAPSGTSYYTSSDHDHISGLILQPAAQGNGTYERIGRYNMVPEKSREALIRSQTLNDKSLYENADGETIVLI